MTGQSTLFGDDQPDDLDLGPTQRAVVRFARRYGTVSKSDIGAVAHDLRGKHEVSDWCLYCGVDGEEIAKRLLARGVLERAPEGEYRVSQPAAVLNAPTEEDDVDVFPPGF